MFKYGDIVTFDDDFYGKQEAKVIKKGANDAVSYDLYAVEFVTEDGEEHCIWKKGSCLRLSK
jgi:hypothetical protein